MGKAVGMDPTPLKSYLKTLSPSEKSRFAKRCGTTLGYLRKAMSVEHRLGEALVVALERESGGAVPCEKLRPDIDWAYLRGSSLSTTRRRAG